MFIIYIKGEHGRFALYTAAGALFSSIVWNNLGDAQDYASSLGYQALLWIN